MTQVLDNTTGQVVDHPDADIAADWNAGKVQPIAGQVYHFRYASGAYGHASTPQEIATAVQSGGQFVSADQAAAAVQAQKYEGETGGAIGAGLSGALSQGTFGLADVAGRAIGGEGYSKARQYQQEAHPIASMVGEGLGAAGLAALTGGGSLAEQGLAAGAEEAAETGLGAIARRAVAKGAASALEGAQFGVSQSISQAAVQDPKLTAEQVISNVGMNALWGGLLGAGLSGAGELLPKRGSSAARALASEPSDEGLAAVAGKALGVDQPAEGLGDKLAKLGAKLSGAVSGHDPDQILSVFANRAELAGAEDARLEAARQITEHGNALMKSGGSVTEEGLGEAKIRQMRHLMEGVDVQDAAKASRDAMDNAIANVQKMADDAEKYGGKKDLRSLLSIAKRHSDALDAAIADSAGGGASDAADMFGIVDAMKRSVGAYTKISDRIATSTPASVLEGMQAQARSTEFKSLYETMRRGLEDEGVWKNGGAAQKAINEAMTSQIDAGDRFRAALTTKYGRSEADAWRKATVIDPEKAASYTRGLLDPAKDLTHKAVTDYIDATKRLAETMGSTYELPAAKMAEVKNVERAAQAFRDTLDEQAKRLTLVNQYKGLTEQASGHALGFGSALGLLGHAVGGLPGGAIGMALGKIGDTLAHPAETIRQVAVLEDMVRNSDSRAARALRAFGVGGAKRVDLPALDTFSRRASQVERAAADPALLEEKVRAATSSLGPHAPQVQQAIVGTSLAASQFLASKLPPKPAIDPLNPKAKAPLPPPGVRESFLRYQRAVDDPHTVIEDLRDGRLAAEGVEALKTVYPSLYARTQQQTLEALSDGKLKDLTAGQRYGLATMLDLPIPELAPQYILARQQAISAPLGAFDPKADTQDKGPKPSKRSKPMPEKKPELTTETLEAGE